jgi:hypothetical protein
VLATRLDISLDEFFEEKLKYLTKNKNHSDITEKYPGTVAGLRVLADYLSKL